MEEIGRIENDKGDQSNHVSKTKKCELDDKKEEEMKVRDCISETV
jgi:hypothetical protein